MGKNTEMIYEMIQDEVESKGIPAAKACKEGGRCNPSAFYAWRSRKAKGKGGQGFVLLKPERNEATPEKDAVIEFRDARVHLKYSGADELAGILEAVRNV